MYRISILMLTGLLCSAASAEETGEWKSIFDGTMTGWKVGKNADSWGIEDGKLVCNGPKAHLFYVGDDEPFTNFEFECETMTTPGSNSGIYFHTDYQVEDWPRWGQECQVNITHRDSIKSGSIYGIVKVTDPPAKDNEWYTTNIRVQGRHVVIKVNDTVVVDYTEPENQPAFSEKFERRLGRGTFALQAHDPKSVVYYRGIKVRRLP
ncbi:MAG: DUF1080 domain-containing protein [Fuerstiella sp.]|nr:DUF1080 domain-containing protein [Fuerstiella sp.]